MIYQQFEENCALFKKLLEDLNQATDNTVNVQIKRHLEQNINLLNDVFTISIEHMQQLQQVSATDDILRLQTRLANEMSQKLALAAHRFLNHSLTNIADYNEWLKQHCDLATD